MLRGVTAQTILNLARAHGATSVRLFGSRARGEAAHDSDLDLLVALEPGRDLLDLIALKQALEDTLGIRADVVAENGLSPHLRESVLAGAIPLEADDASSSR